MEAKEIKRSVVVDIIALEVHKILDKCPFEVIFSKSRKREIVETRQVVQYFCKKYTKFTYEKIGKETGNEEKPIDHSTVLHACKSVKNLIDTDKTFKNKIQEIDECLKRALLPYDPSLKKTYVLIESPFQGDKENNKQYAREAMTDSISKGETPIVPHLMFTQVLNDDISEEREIGLTLAMSFHQIVDKIVAYTDKGVSEGMQRSISKAIKMNIDVEYRLIK